MKVGDERAAAWANELKEMETSADEGTRIGVERE